MQWNKFFSFPLTILLPVFAIVVLQFSACEGEDNSQRLIMVEFKDTSIGASVFFTSKDGYYDSGGASIGLREGSNYMLNVRFQDESNEDITAEIENDGENYLVCFEVEGVVPQPGIVDLDDNGKPLGLKSYLIPSGSNRGYGKLTVRLKHFPDKNFAAPCETGDIVMEATFNMAFL